MKDSFAYKNLEKLNANPLNLLEKQNCNKQIEKPSPLFEASVLDRKFSGHYS